MALTFDASLFLKTPIQEPERPISLRDLPHVWFDVLRDEDHLADPCPTCGGFRMSFEDWMLWDQCSVCEFPSEQRLRTLQYYRIKGVHDYRNDPVLGFDPPEDRQLAAAYTAGWVTGYIE